MLPRLNGIFAFALHDRRDGSLVLACDAFAIKPLYLKEFDGGVAFASEAKGLLPFGAPALDLASIQRYLTFLWCPGGGTPARDTRRVGPGEIVVIRERRVVSWRRWYVPPLQRCASDTARRQDPVTAVRDALRTAVQRQLVSDAPLGAFLSGGLDSSAVVCFARENLPRIACFTIETEGGRDAGETDDLPYARSAAEHLDVPLHVVRVDPARMLRDIERLVWQLDEPLADPAPLNLLYICEAAREQGIKVLLSGAGGDDVFSGYRRHVALRLERYWSWLPAGLRRGLAAGSRLFDQRTGIGRRVARLFQAADASPDERLLSYFFWSRPEELERLYTPAFRAAVGGSKADQPLRDFLAGMPAERDPLDRMLALEQRFFLADHNLLYTDKMSMAAGIEVRVPFLDVDLVELAAAIPADLKQHGLSSKWVLKQAMRELLPANIIDRPKTGFGVPLRRWMREDLHEFLCDTLSSDSFRRRDLFDIQAVQRLIADNRAGKVDATYTLFSLLCIEIWCRLSLDRRGVNPVSVRPLEVGSEPCR
jgi:asparagine synthase (glutamine-hydrolysing)